ncbi:MAG: hypothetical protein IJY21_03235 [Clostridia bacterium]|nr:hypothetical protein [Clostridia bacterium]
MTEDKKELTFQYACKHYLRSKSLEKLRAYGRSIGVNRSTAKNKDALIEDIVGVLSGRLEPTYTKRGAPVLNDNVDSQIPERIKQIYEDVFQVVLPADTFDVYSEYQKMLQNPNRLTVEESEYKLRQDGTVFLTKTGQLQQIDGVYYLLPLDGKDNGESVVMHAEIVARYALLDGDVVCGEAAQGQTAFILSTVTEINGESVATFQRENRENGLPCEPTQALPLYDSAQAAFDTCKYIEWLAPIRKGQRCCIVAPPKAGKSRLLQELAQGARTLNPETTFLALLIDQPPEAIGQFARFIEEDNLIYTTYDDEADRQVFLAEFILNRAKRLAASGKDVVLLVDSFNGLAKAFNDTEQSIGGKTLPCGLESKTLQYIKRYLASAGCVGKNGSLSIIGTATTATGNPFDEIIAAEISPIVNHEIRLNEKMAYKRIYPALDRTQIHVDRRTWTAEEEKRNALVDEYLMTHDAETLLSAVLSAPTVEEFEKRIKTAL